MPLDRLRVALEAAAVGLWDWNVESGDLWWSDNLATIHGFPASAFDGTFDRFRSFILPDDRNDFDRALARALESGEDFAVDFRVNGSDGITRWIRGQGRVFRNDAGKPVRVIGIGLDVTKRRQQENAIRELGVIAMASSDAIIAVDADGIVTAWNPGAEHLYGYGAPEMIGAPIHRVAPPEQSAEVDEIIARLASGERLVNVETERRRKDGSRIFVSLSSGPIFDGDGEMIGAVTVTRDITARRQEEDRQRFLAEAGDVLNASLDADATLAAIADLAVRRLADWCTIHLVREDGHAERAIVAHRDEQKVAWAQDVLQAFPYDPDAPIGVPKVLRTGQPEIYGAITEDMLRAATDDSALLDALHHVGLSSALIVPMIARGVTIGTISLFAAESGRHYTHDDLALAMELARRSALAVDNAMLFARVHAAERQLRLVADNLPALVSYVDSDLRYRFVNRRYGDWHGIPSSSLVDRPVPDVMQPDEFDIVRPYLEQALNGNAVRYDFEKDFPVVGKRHVEVDYVPDVAPNGVVRGTVALSVDVSERERNQRRVTRLYELTAALAGAKSEDEVAACIVQHGVSALEGSAGAVLSFDPNGDCLKLLTVAGFPPRFQPGDCFPIDSEAPFAQAATDGRPYLLGAWKERIRELPEHESFGDYQGRGAFAALPLTIEGRRLGTFAVAFPNDRVFQQSDVEFMMTLSNLCAQSFDRARAYDAERQARAQAEAERARVTFLADASRILAASFDIRTELRRVMALAASSLADWCCVHLVQDDGSLRRLGAVHRDASKADAIHALETEYAVLPASAWRSVRKRLEKGKSWFDPAVDPNRLAAESRDERHLSLLRQLGFGGEIVVPMMAGGRTFGSMTFVRSPESTRFSEEDLRLAEELASRTALAIDNARLFEGAQSSEARYRSLFNGVADAILIVDSGGVVRGGNPAAAALLGTARDGLVDSSLFDVLVDKSMTEALLEHRWFGELELVRVDGSTVPVEAQTTRVDLPNGQATLIALRDTTQRRTLERLQRDFLAMVTHDLRSPLSAIRVQSQLMRRRGAYSEESVDAIVSQTDRMARLINALADVIRMDSGRLNLNRRPLDLVDLVREVVDQECLNAPHREIVVESQGSVVGEWDGDRLGQVIANLVGNAVKYSGDESRVVVRVDDLGEEASVAVSDFGDGIPEEHLPKLFERFYRADMTGAGGLGLGLYIARMLTEAQGGRIAVESRVGDGSVFTVTLPKC